LGDRIFVGRDREMVDLHALLQGNDQVAIAAVGMSGVGKTTLARHYVREYAADYPGGVWWLSARTMVTDILGYVERMGMRSELPTDFTEVQIVQYYFDRWHKDFAESKLVVLDDVADYGAVKELLPKQGLFQVLMTTKVRFGKPVKLLPLGVLRLSAAFRLLRSHIGDDEKFNSAVPAARALCEWLGCLPLAIELVGRYLAETGTIEKVLGQLKAKALEAKAISEVPGEMDYELNVRAAIELSWEPLGEDARRVAMVLGVFALGPIALDWLQNYLADWVEEILNLELVRHSWVERTEEGYRLHSLVWEFLQEKLDEELDAGEVRLRCALLMMSITSRYRDEGRYQKAIPLCQQSFTINKAHLGDRHPDTVTSMNNLAELYKSMSQYDRALPLLESALEIRQSELGDRHPDTATSMNNLAGLYQSICQYDRALLMLESALEIRQSELGNRHPDTAMSMNNLAHLYQSMGRYDRSLSLFESALEISQSELGTRHPDTAICLNNLALLYRSMGQYDRSLPLFESVLEICQSELGNRHPNTATSMNNLAESYQFIGHYDQALLLYESALEIYQSEYGDRNLNVARILDNFSRSQIF
jgi:tetratricopeptide (TPR) repeat protein